MAAQCTATVLHVSSECQAVEEGEKEGEALITFSRAVEVYNLQDNHCVHSWPVGSSREVTCHAIFLKASGVYCAVLNETELLLWKSEDNILPSAHLTLHSPPLTILPSSLPHTLITVDSAGSVTMVTVEGGEVRVVSQVNLWEGRKRRSVVKCVMSEVGGREGVVVMCGGGDVFVCAVESSGLSLTATINSRTKISHSSVCVCGNHLLMAGKGVISSLVLTSASILPRHLSTSSNLQKLASISPTLFATVANNGGVVTLRDSLYGTHQGSVNSGLNHIEMIWSVWGYVLMCGGEGVRVCRVSCGDSVSLAAVLGRKATPPPEEAIAVASKWVGPQSSVCWRSEVVSSEERETMHKLCDCQQTPTMESVCELFPSPLSLPPPTYLPLVRRLVREREFWAHNQLSELVKAGAVTGSEAGEVVERALQQGDWAVIVLTVNNSQGVPESSIVSLLQHALDLPEKVESHGEELNRETIVWSVLRLPYSDSLLGPPLSLLPIPSVLSLLQFLTPHVSVASLCRPPPLPYSKLLDWLAVVLDTHWPALSLSPSAKQLLHNFKHTTYHQMLFCENLATVENVLEAVKRPRRVRQLPDNYITVERVKIKI